jgi:hypothetical protein
MAKHRTDWKLPYASLLSDCLARFVLIDTQNLLRSRVRNRTNTARSYGTVSTVLNPHRDAECLKLNGTVT